MFELKAGRSQDWLLERLIIRNYLYSHLACLNLARIRISDPQIHISKDPDSIAAEKVFAVDLHIESYSHILEPAFPFWEHQNKPSWF